MQNVKGNGHFLAITIRTGVTTIDPLLPVAIALRHDETVVDEKPIVE